MSRALRDTARANGPAPSLDIHMLARLAAPFVVLLIAYLVGIVTESVEAFVVVYAAGLALLPGRAVHDLALTHRDDWEQACSKGMGDLGQGVAAALVTREDVTGLGAVLIGTSRRAP